ncbi:MAG TPA: hypothetical protein VFX25_25720 [Streptosporangiaceae bacterium]|nr:hypothetical protein [Streptosporangiaceae bacterium]
MRGHRLRAWTTLVVVPVLIPALVAAGNASSHAGATHTVRSGDECTAPTSAPAPTPTPGPVGAADDPVGVTFESLSPEANGAIRIDGVPAPGTTIGGNLNYAVVSRADRSIVASGSVSRGTAGIATLLGIDDYYGKFSYGCLLVVSGTAGIGLDGLPGFKTLAKQLGVTDADLTPAITDALTQQSAPFSVLGYPGPASQGAWLNVGLVPDDLPPAPPFDVPAKGDLIGRIQWDITTDQYDYVDGQYPEFNTDVMRDGAATGTISFNGEDYPAGDTRGTSGFHVLVADSVNLRVLADQTLPTNSATAPAGPLQDKFARDLAADAHMDGFEQFYKNKATPLILLQSYGHPAGAAQAWQDASKTVAELGGNRFAFLALDAKSGEFSLVGRIGGQDFTVLASTYTGQPGPLTGVLTRTRTMTFEPTSAGPLHGVNFQMLKLAYQQPEPFPPFPGGEAKAEAWIGVQLGFCKAGAACDLRLAYRSDYGAVTWVTKAAQLMALKYPQGQGFTNDEFLAVQSELNTEFLDVENVKVYFTDLARVFYAVSGNTLVNVQDIGDEVLRAVQPPSVEKPAFLLTLISKITLLGTLFRKASPMASGVSAALALIAYLVSQSGKSALPDAIRTRTTELARQLSVTLSQAAENFGVIGRLVASDYGKLTRFQSLYLTDEWKLEPSTQPATTAITRAARQWFAGQLVPVAYPWLVVGWGARPNDLECFYYTPIPGLPAKPSRHDVKPWETEPDKAQFQTVVAYADGKPVTQSVFFGMGFRVGHAKNNAPPESLANFLYAEGQSTGDPVPYMHSLLSEANFGTAHKATNGASCPGSS